MLLVAVLPLPYGYYTAMRIIVCGAAAYIVYRHWNEDGISSLWRVVFFVIIALFNPIIPIHLTKLIWQPLNVGAAACFALHWWKCGRRETHE